MNDDGWETVYVNWLKISKLNKNDILLRCVSIVKDFFDIDRWQIGQPIVLSDNIFNQKNPSVHWSGHSFMISWEDGRNDVTGRDIYFQEYNNGLQILQSGGDALSDFDQKQERPIISKYSESETDNSYVILWEDYRSTGKEFCANLYGQSYQSKPCCALGNMNCDFDSNGIDTFNVLDIVTLANCVLAGNCPELRFACTADLNGDGDYNVLDFVTLANCVLAQNCSNRVDDASHSRLIMQDNVVSIEADGFIGGVQMTLQHGDDFSIKMTDRALFADYRTSGNETRLLVITPETDELFSYSGDFEITEVIVANSQNEVPTSLPVLYSLSAAYPNPFNPVTTMEFTMPEAGNVSVQVYNLKGQVVSTLLSGHQMADTYNLTWDASQTPSGIYFVKAKSAEYIQTQKLMLIK